MPFDLRNSFCSCFWFGLSATTDSNQRYAIKHCFSELQVSRCKPVGFIKQNQQVRIRDSLSSSDPLVSKFCFWDEGENALNVSQARFMRYHTCFSSLSICAFLASSINVFNLFLTGLIYFNSWHSHVPGSGRHWLKTCMLHADLTQPIHAFCKHVLPFLDVTVGIYHNRKSYPLNSSIWR